MKHLLPALLLSLGSALFTAPAQAADVGVSISISQPGVYGRIDIGRFPQPVLVQPRPIVIHAPRVAVEPVYLWVPPGHQKNWRKYCSKYQACGVPVYFVQEGWYQDHVMAPHPGKGRKDKDKDKGPGKSQERGHGKGRD